MAGQPPLDAMDCSIRVIKGPDTGSNVPVSGGTLVMGRSPRAGLKLSGADISFEHAQIIRNGEECTLENLSAAGSYLGDARVVGSVKLRHRDQIRLSADTVIRFECTGAGSGGGPSQRTVLAIILVVLVAIALLMAFNPFEREGGHNWGYAYRNLQKWVAAEESAGRMPPTTNAIFQEGWRLEQAQNYKRSREAWVQMQMVIEQVDRQGNRRLSAASDADPAALERLLLGPPTTEQGTSATPSSPPDSRQLGAALVQFVRRRLAWSTANSKDGGAFGGVAP